MGWSVKFQVEICFMILAFFYGELACASQREDALAVAIIQEMNLARRNPARYAGYIEELRQNYNAGFAVLPTGTKWRMKEGLRAIDEAASFLRAAYPEQPLRLSPGMCRSAADHCADQAGGRTGHGGSDRSSPRSRLSHYGSWTGPWGENIAYGKTTARDIVITLIIDDGNSARPHRKNIFNSDFNYAGAACGPHARYGSVCTIDFVHGYLERSSAPASTSAR